jgi:hypothetical protein
MNRRKFFKSLAIGVTAVVVTPKLLASKPKLDGYTVTKPQIGGIKMQNDLSMIRKNDLIGYDTGRGIYWIHKAEWDAQKSWYETQEEIMLKQMKEYAKTRKYLW